MNVKQKRGQFFIIAALVIISILFSFGIIYNFASAQKTDSKTRILADTIKYESLMLINQVFYNKPDTTSYDDLYTSITNNINDLAKLYSESNPEYKIIIIYSTPPSTPPTFEASQYVNGHLTSPSPSNDGIDITLNLNSIDYKFNIIKGYNIFVIVTKEDTNERHISTA